MGQLLVEELMEVKAKTEKTVNAVIGVEVKPKHQKKCWKCGATTRTIEDQSRHMRLIHPGVSHA